MKKILMCLSLLVFGVVLASCGNNNVDPNDYSIDKEIKIKKEADIKDLEDDISFDISKYLSLDIMVHELEGEEKIIAYSSDIDVAIEDGKLNLSAINSSKFLSQEFYAKDNFLCFDYGSMLGKYKTELKDIDSYIKESLTKNSYNFSEILDEFLDEFDLKDTENLKAGYDKAGCFIIDYKQEDKATLRCVINGSLPVYLYVYYDKISIEIKCSYDKTEIVYPDDFNLDDYKLIEDFDDIL